MSELQRLFLTRGVEAAVQCSNVIDFECDLLVLFLPSLTASQSDKTDPYLSTQGTRPDSRLRYLSWLVP